MVQLVAAAIRSAWLRPDGPFPAAVLALESNQRVDGDEGLAGSQSVSEHVGRAVADLDADLVPTAAHREMDRAHAPRAVGHRHRAGRAARRVLGEGSPRRRS